MSGLLDALKAAVEDDDNDRKVVRKEPMRPTWTAKMSEMMALADELRALHEKKDRLKKRFWIMIEDDLQCYDSMRYNIDENCVEILED